MPFTTTALERVLHLLLFVAAAVAIGVAALGAVERLVDAGRLVRAKHVLVPAGVFVLLLAVERLYHALA